MSALDEALKIKLKKEFMHIGILFVLSVIIFKIAFYKESFIVILRTVASIFWLFVLPGFAIMYYWHDRLEMPVRLVLGIGFSAAVIGILSYYIGLFGLHVKYHTILLPLAMILTGIFLIFRQKQTAQ
jgi:uncharacterized membrane protein